MQSTLEVETALTFKPRVRAIRRIVRGSENARRAFRIVVNNPSRRAARPVFVPSVRYVSVGPSDEVDVSLDGSWGDRTEFRAVREIGTRDSTDGGQRAFDVYIDAQHQSVPEGLHRNVPVVIEIFEMYGGRYLPVGAVAMKIEEITDRDPVYGGVVAIDFGTANTCVVVTPNEGWQPTVLRLDHQADTAARGVRSIVAYESVFNPSRPRYQVGATAAAHLRHSDRTTVFQSIKRHVGSQEQWLVGVDASQNIVEYSAQQVADHFLSEVRERAEEEIHARIVEPNCTYPAAFSRDRRHALAQVYTSAQSRVPATAQAGAVPCRMITDEATAAAVYYLRQRFCRIQDIQAAVGARAFHVLCYDLGGGTTDISLVRFQLRGGDTTPVGEDSDAATLIDASEGTYVQGEVVSTDGLPWFGGDNMTLEVFRLLKAQYACAIVELLEQRIRSGSALRGDEVRQGEIVRALRKERTSIERWLAGGSGLEADASIGLGAQPGQPLDPSIWDLFDELVPTRFHERLDLDPAEQERRQLLFSDLWFEAERVKRAFGTAEDDGQHPSEVLSRPPLALQDRYDLGGGTTIRVADKQLFNHLAPAIRRTLCQASTLVSEASLQKVDFFVLAGNACRLPLVRTLFDGHMKKVGARPDADEAASNVFFDAAQAKTAVAQGACMIAFERQAAGLSTWRFKERRHVLHHDVGRPKPEVSFQDRSKTMHVWFERGTALPAHRQVRVAGNNPRLRIVGLRRPGAEPETLGVLDFSKEESRGTLKDLPQDARDAIETLGLSDFAHQEDSEHFTIDVILTAEQRIWAQRANHWFALYPARVQVEDDVDPFSGTH